MTFSNLPNLQSFKTGNYSFYQTTSLSLSSNSIIFDYLIFSNLPNLQELEIGEGCFREVKYDLEIENYPNLEKIVVKNSLKNLNSLKICNNEKLKIIEIEDGDIWNGAFYYVKNVIIDSISIILFDISNLPNLQSFKTGIASFYWTTSLSLSSTIIIFDYFTFQIFLIYNHLKQDVDHSIK